MCRCVPTWLRWGLLFWFFEHFIIHVVLLSFFSPTSSLAVVDLTEFRVIFFRYHCGKQVGVGGEKRELNTHIRFICLVCSVSRSGLCYSLMVLLSRLCLRSSSFSHRNYKESCLLSYLLLCECFDIAREREREEGE